MGENVLHIAIKNKNMKSILKLLLLKCDLKIKNEFLLIEKEKYDQLIILKLF